MLQYFTKNLFYTIIFSFTKNYQNQRAVFEIILCAIKNLNKLKKLYFRLLFFKCNIPINEQ